MTVQEAIEILKGFNPQAIIKTPNHCGFKPSFVAPVFSQEYNRIYIEPSQEVGE